MLFASYIFLLVSLVGVTTFYAATANWRRYAAGQRLMTLLASMIAVVAFASAVRLFGLPEHARQAVGPGLMFALAGAVLWMGWTMYQDWRRGIADQRAALADTDQRTDSDHS